MFLVLTAEMKKHKDKIREFIKFTASSLASTVVDLVLFAILVWFLKPLVPATYITIATVIARIASILVNYNINARMVFSGKDDRTLPFAKYITLAIFDMLASAFFVTILVGYWGWNETVIKMLVDSGLFFVGYLVQRIYIF